MTLNEFETSLYHKLYDFFYDRGYEMMAGKKQFRKYYSGGFKNIIFSPSVYGDECWLELNLGVRNDLVEEIVQQFLDNYKEFQNDTNTIIISIGKLTNNKYFKYKATDNDDLELICEQIESFMLHEGFSFLDKVSSIKYIDILFNRYPAKPSKFVYNQSHRCFKGLIVAKLVNNKKYKLIKDIYREALKTYGTKPLQLKNFEKLVTFLQHYSAN
ncbi:hypothetical protein [Chondrinema litorale]|uniref:hypothetical protein n=1 Tax=Chondrinema litorale TaxID=2994555 RepID=UPI002542E018|nr:hypothetical protein [Chondrinema litorale]UZR96025.1 hypothetical protein OQ292_09410 [Chondrinema litorale]